VILTLRRRCHPHHLPRHDAAAAGRHADPHRAEWGESFV